MLRTRVIPCLLLLEGRLVKTIKFKKPDYVGDPINIVRIFNNKEVDELVFLDISPDAAKRGPRFDLIKEIASECFMPFAYGGGITSLEQAASLFNLGVEKIILNSHAVLHPKLVYEIAQHYGSQAVMVSIDVKKNFFGKYYVYINKGQKNTKLDPVQHALMMQEQGAGEILLTSMDNDGMMKGYNLELIKSISSKLSIPVIASGGAGEIDDFAKAVKIGGASAVAAGSMVVYQGRNRAVLTSFPSRQQLIELLA